MIVGLSCGSLRAQEKEKETKTVEKEKPAEPAPAPPKEESSVTDHTIKIGAQTIPYKATIGSLLLKNEKKNPSPCSFTPHTRAAM